MLFSVVVPVYNIRGYLRDCIESVLEQTFQDYELILVDDGSTDGSGEICDKYAEQSERVLVVHQENGGPGEARFTGVKRAKGDYVLYVDGDDWIERETLQWCASYIEKYRVDVISFSYQFEKDAGVYLSPEPVSEGYYNREAISSDILPLALMGEGLCNMHYASGRAVRRSLLLECQAKADRTMRLGEDTALSVLLYAAAESVYISGRTGYHYRVREQSASHGIQEKLFSQVEQAVRYFERAEPIQIPDFSEQRDRYVFMLLFSLTVMAVEENAKDNRTRVTAYLGQELFQPYLRRARLRGVTAKVRITRLLFGKKYFKMAYSFLKLCEWIKRIF